MSKIEEARARAAARHDVDATPHDVVWEFIGSMDRVEIARVLSAERNKRENNVDGVYWEHWSKSSQEAFLSQADAIIVYMAGQ